MLAHSVIRTVVVTLTAMLLIMFFFRIGPVVEARFWPVVDDVYVTVEETSASGVEVLLSYDKRRDCEWFGVAWYVGTVRLPIDFQAEEEFLPRSRTVGEHLVGPWTVRNIDILKGTRAEIYHRCHPLWLVHNTLYPPRGTWDRREHVKISDSGDEVRRFTNRMRD